MEKFCGKFSSWWREPASDMVQTVGGYRASDTRPDRGKKRQNRYFGALFQKMLVGRVVGPTGVIDGSLVGKNADFGWLREKLKRPGETRTG